MPYFIVVDHPVCLNGIFWCYDNTIIFKPSTVFQGTFSLQTMSTWPFNCNIKQGWYFHQNASLIFLCKKILICALQICFSSNVMQCCCFFFTYWINPKFIPGTNQLKTSILFKETKGGQYEVHVKIFDFEKSLWFQQTFQTKERIISYPFFTQYSLFRKCVLKHWPNVFSQYGHKTGTQIKIPSEIYNGLILDFCELYISFIAYFLVNPMLSNTQVTV